MNSERPRRPRIATPPRFYQRDLQTAINGAKRCGQRVNRITIDADGKITLEVVEQGVTVQPGAAQYEQNEWDRVLAQAGDKVPGVG